MRFSPKNSNFGYCIFTFNNKSVNLKGEDWKTVLESTCTAVIHQSIVYGTVDVEIYYCYF
jgi:hypothetical protein